VSEPTVTFTVPVRVWEYLGWLHRNTMLGRSEHEVARSVLSRRLEDMRQSNYHDDELIERAPPSVQHPKLEASLGLSTNS
jgi:hypothetical protein